MLIVIGITLGLVLGYVGLESEHYWLSMIGVVLVILGLLCAL